MSEILWNNNWWARIYWLTIPELKNDLLVALADVKAWKELRFCRCSHTPTRDIIQLAMDWSIGEKYRLIDYYDPQKDSAKLDRLLDDLITVLLKDMR